MLVAGASTCEVESKDVIYIAADALCLRITSAGLAGWVAVFTHFLVVGELVNWLSRAACAIRSTCLIFVEHIFSNFATLTVGSKRSVTGETGCLTIVADPLIVWILRLFTRISADLG